MDTPNQAVWADGVGCPFRIDHADMPVPDADEVIIRNHAIAINPLDWKIRDLGLHVTNWPTILGHDVAGVIVQLGANVQSYRLGDRITGQASALATKKLKNAGYQLFTAMDVSLISKLPDNLSFVDGSVLPTAIGTASSGLFQDAKDGYLGLISPSPTKGQKPNVGKTLVVYGGSSSVGSMAIQLAAASGATVIAVASRRHFDLNYSCGATEVVDYGDPHFVDIVVDHIERCGIESFVGIFEAISSSESLKNTLMIMQRIKRGNIAKTLPLGDDFARALPAGVQTRQVFALAEQHRSIWTDFVPAALHDGTLKCLPAAKVVGVGLDDVQKACDMSKDGVSGNKLVVRLV